MKLDPRIPQYEIVRVGFCQLGFACFKDIYELLKKGLCLPDLSREPEITAYDDGSYALNWWPHQFYHQPNDKLFIHKSYLLSEEGEY